MSAISVTDALNVIHDALECLTAEPAYDNLRGAGAVCCKSMRDQLEAAQRTIGAKQARIDALMTEYCPDEMTAEQWEEWGRNQVPVSPDEGITDERATPKVQP